MDTNKFKKEKTLVLIKPDGVKKGLVGEIIKRFEHHIFAHLIIKT